MPTISHPSTLLQPGTIEIGPFQMPRRLQSFDVTLTSNDWNEPGRTLHCLMEQSFDNGQTWQHWMDATFETGTFTRFGDLPSFGLDDSVQIDREVRAYITVSGGPIRCGFIIDTK